MADQGECMDGPCDPAAVSARICEAQERFTAPVNASVMMGCPSLRYLLPPSVPCTARTQAVPAAHRTASWAAACYPPAAPLGTPSATARTCRERGTLSSLVKDTTLTNAILKDMVLTDTIYATATSLTVCHRWWRPTQSACAQTRARSAAGAGRAGGAGRTRRRVAARAG